MASMWKIAIAISCQMLPPFSTKDAYAMHTANMSLLN